MNGYGGKALKIEPIDWPILAEETFPVFSGAALPRDVSRPPPKQRRVLLQPRWLTRIDLVWAEEVNLCDRTGTANFDILFDGLPIGE
jgi:hypothetical protein